MTNSQQQPPVDNQNSPLWSPSTKFIVTGTLLFLLLATLYMLRALLLPLILALVLAYVLHPVVSFIVRKTRIKRGLVTAGIYLVMIAVLISIPAATIPSIIAQVNSFITNLPVTIEQVAAFLETPPEIEVLGFTVPVAQLPVDQVIDGLIGLVQTAGSQSLVLLRNITSSTVQTVIWVIFVLFVSFWVVKDERQLYQGLVSIVPRPFQPDALRLSIEIDTVWNSFLRGQVVLSLTIGTVVFIVATILGLPSPVVLGIIAGVLEVVPYIGPILSAVPAALLAYFQYDQSWLGSAIGPFWFMLIVILSYWGVQQMENYFIVPRVMGRQLKIHPVVVFIAALSGASIAGVFGIFLASPILATLRIFGRYIARKLSDRPPFPLVEASEWVMPQPTADTPSDVPKHDPTTSTNGFDATAKPATRSTNPSRLEGTD